MMNEPLSSIMSTGLTTLSPDDLLDKAKNIFLSTKIHHLPVVIDNDRLVGLITSYDLCKLSVKNIDFDTMKVSDVMTTRIATLEPNEKIGAAAEVLLEHLFHAVPIVLDGRLKGIVSSFDILKYEFAKEYPKHALLTRK